MIRLLIFILIILYPFLTKAQAVDGDKRPVKAYFKKGKLTFESEDKDFKLWFDNRIYINAAVYLPTGDISNLSSKPNKDLDDDDGQFRFNNGMIIRRARFGIKASIYKRWFAELDIDFAYNEIEVKDMYIGYKFSDKTFIKIGNFKEPMSMERLTSSRYITNMERPMIVEALGGGRRLGISATVWDEHWWFSGGLFGRKVDILQKEKNRSSDGYSITARAAFSPILRNDVCLHIGAYGSYRVPDLWDTDYNFVKFRTFPESRIDRRRFVRTEVKNINNYATGGLEFGFKYNKFLLTGEYLYTNISRYSKKGGEHIKLKNAKFNGWYSTLSYMLIGEQKYYSIEEAEFWPMNINKKGGNLELVGRISNINLNDFSDSQAIITGGQAQSYSFAANWYPNRNILIGINYSYIDNDKYADDKGHIKMNGKKLKDAMPEGVDFNIIQLRLLISF